jgi:prevent-host-death family protein
MKLVSFRDLRNVPGKVRELIELEDVVLTMKGRPVAVLVSVGEDDDLEETLRAVRRAKLQAVVSGIRRDAAKAGTDRLSAEEIETEIRAAHQDLRS